MPPRVSRTRSITRPARSGVVLGQPFAEEVRDLQRQAEHRIAHPEGAGLPRVFEDGFELGVVDEGDHRGGEHPGRDAGLAQAAHRFEAAVGGGGARLHAAGEGAVEGGDAHADAATVGAGHGAEDVEVALHPRGLGDDHHRMPAFGEHFEDGAGDPEVALDRLVGVGVGPQRDRAQA